VATDRVTVAIPTIPPRRMMLARAISSVVLQDYPVHDIAVAVDHDHDGAWATRNRAASRVRTEWTAFLDDDDELMPNHTAALLAAAKDHDADIVWGWFRVIGGQDPFPWGRGKQYDPDSPDHHIVPITYMVRTELLAAATDALGGFLADDAQTGAWQVQDKPLFDLMCRMGKAHTVPDLTWVWHHHASNTSGLPSRWR
jgi:glycosyltransferase involved in cell wall biosynthesis